jgi:hypothetical protein
VRCELERRGAEVDTGIADTMVGRDGGPRERPKSCLFALLAASRLAGDASRTGALHNHWDQAALAALLSRPIDPREHEELDGYRELHGACTRFALKEARSPTDATFAMTCERGRFELGMNLAGRKLAGFAGVSHEVPVPPEVPRAVNVALQLLARWDEAAFARAFADAKTIHDQIKQSSTFIGDDAGACKPGEIAHEILGWGVDATCQRAKLHFYMEMDGPKIKRINSRKLDGEICPVK